MTDQIHEAVKDRYGRAALDVLNNENCCGQRASDEGTRFYSEVDRDSLPDTAVLASLGCGNPVMVAELNEGERVLDLGSGGGIDVLLSARRVGPTGRAFGLDMTDEMLALAQKNAAEAGVTNVEWLRGEIESIPLPAASIDVVISNCVVNLAVDKPAVFREMYRVLKPGGRIGIADMVADDTPEARRTTELGSYTGCVAGALSFSEYRCGLVLAGFTDVSISTSHEAAPGLFSAIVKAVKPRDARAQTAAAPATSGASATTPAAGSCCG
jgi:SAM-dependent methyltransferase